MIGTVLRGGPPHMENKTMRHLFSRLLLSLVLFLPLPAFAAWDLVQDGNGGTYWVDRTDGEANHVSEGRISLYMSDISVASTGYVVSPVKGKVIAAYSVIYDQIRSTSAEEIRLHIGTNASSGTGPTGWTEVSNGVTGIIIAASSVTGASDTTSEYTTGNTITQGGVIAVFSKGSSVANVSTVPAMITIIIDPR